MATGVWGGLESSLFNSYYTDVGKGATFPWLLPLTLDPCLIMLSIKQDSIKNQFLSLWYDSARDWTQVSQTFGEYSNCQANGLVIGLMSRLFAYGLGVRGSILIPKTQKMVLVLFNQRTNEAVLYKNISLILFSKEAHCLLLVEREMERHILREGTSSCPISSSRSPGVPPLAPTCKPCCQRWPNPLLGYVSLAPLAILWTLSKSDRGVIMWSLSDYTPVGPDCPDALSSPVY